MIMMLVTSKIRQEKIVEFLQTMDSLPSAKKSTECRLDFFMCRRVHQPSVLNIVFEWEKEEEFERYLDGNEFNVVCGAVSVLCDETTFCCNSLSEKWSRLTGNFQKNYSVGALADGNAMYQENAVEIHSGEFEKFTQK